MKKILIIIAFALIPTFVSVSDASAATIPDGYDGSNPPRLQCTNKPVTPGVPESYIGTYCQCPFYENAMHGKGCVPPPDIKCNADWSHCEYVGTSWTPEPAPEKPMSEPKTENRTNTHSTPKSAPVTPESTNTTYSDAPIVSNVNETVENVDIDDSKVNKNEPRINNEQRSEIVDTNKSLDDDIEKAENGVKAILAGMTGFFAIAFSAIGLIARFMIFKS